MTDSSIRIEFRRSGGFAGIPLVAAIDTGQLTDEHSTEVQRLLAAEEVAQPPDQTMSRGGAGADRFQYALSLSDGQRHRDFAWDDGQVPSPIRPLLERLTRLSRPAPREQPDS